MEADNDEDKLLRSAVLQNSASILSARQRSEQELIRAKEELELKTAKLAHSLSTIRATLESTTDGILVTDLEGRVTDLNEKCLQMWGFAREEAGIKKHQQLQEASAGQLKNSGRFLARIDEIYASWPPETFDLLEFVDGRVFERYSRIQRIDQKAVGRVWSYRDITEHKRAERALREQSEWFRVTLGSIGDAVMTVDSECRVTFLNPIAEKLTGWTLADALGRPMGDVMRIVDEPTGARAINPIRRALAEGVIVGLANHTILLARDGSQIPIEDSASPIKDQGGAIIGAVMVFHDVSDRRRKEHDLARIYEAEQQARDAAEQANSAKDHFLAALSHELRTPLTPVLAILSSLLEAPAISAEMAEDLKTIRRNVEVEARLIDDLLDLTRITRGKLELRYEFTAVDRLIAGAIDICRADLENKRLSLVRQFEASDRPIQVDRVRITQILWNLLKNAIKFTPSGGTITVRSSTASRDGLEWLAIEVRDTGRGMEASERERIFRPFEQGGRKITREYGGLGLGLSISNGIAAAHRGEISAASEGIGHGSTFTLTLPYGEWEEAKPQIKEAPPRARSIESPLEIAGSKGRRMRILLVEDHADTATILVRLLRRLGYDVIHAGTVGDALRLAKKELQGAGIDLVMSDVGLPDGSGLDMMRELSVTHGLRGIAISGYGTEADLAKSAAAGFVRHLIKPVDVLALRTAVAAVLNEK